MTDFAITVRDRAVTVDRRPTVVVSGSVNVYTMSVVLDDSWDGYTCRAVFRCGFELREVLIVDGACTVPWETLVANESLYIGVYGIDGDKRMPTCWTPERIYVAPGTATADASQDPSPTVFEELVAQTADNRAAAEAARDAAEAAKQGTAADRLTVAGDKTNVSADREAVESMVQQVSNDATRAENAANAAVDAAIEAAKSETAAKDASAQAGMDAEQTAQDREAADASKVAAETAKTAAQTAETNAETAQTAAETARTGAQTAETNAGTYATNAGNSATAAAGSATDAQSAQTAADSARDAAVTAKTAAEAARDTAVLAKTAAETAETNAETAESNAQTYATNAGNSATAALTAQSAAETAAQAAAAHDIVLQTGLTAVQQLAARSNIDAQKQAWETTIGYIATCTDANAGTCYPTIYGNSVQDGTPTPEAPVAVVSANPTKLVRTGKNLWNLTDQNLHFMTGASDNNISPAGNIATGVFNLLPIGQQITLACDFTRYVDDNVLNPRINIWFYYTDGTKDENTGFYNQIPADGNTRRIFTTCYPKKEISKIQFWLADYSSQTFRHFQVTNIQLELGTIATKFVPYTAQTIQFTALSDSLPGIKLGATVPAALQGRKGLWYDGTDWWIGNWMDADSGKMGVNVAKKVFDGTENLWYSVNYSSFVTPFTGAMSGNGMCTHFRYITTGIVTTDNSTLINPSSIYIHCNAFSGDESQIKNMLAAQHAAGTPVTVYYITATETVTDIPSDTLSTLRSITTLDGTNNIMVDGSTVQPWLSVKYRQDLQKYVKDKLAALQAAIISLGGNI